jgi:hypothetical protein
MLPGTPRRGRSTRRLRVLLAGVAVVAAVAALGVMLALRPTDRSPAPPAVAAPGSPASPAPPPGAAPPPAPAVPAPELAVASADAGAREVEDMLAGMAATSTIRYAFDAGPGRDVVDTAGRHALRPVVARGGTVAFARHGDGYAVRFPARCRSAPADCPRAILESARIEQFNAGTRPIRFGAAVLMTSADTAAGANVMQKGFSVGGGTQYKVQVDGRAGRPSCVLARGGSIYRLAGPVTVADGRWHAVACTRIGGRLSIIVDGRAVSRRVPADLSIRNNEPLRIGGKNAGPNNDQFAGRLDNVFVTLY